MKKEIPINDCSLPHNFLEKNLLRPLMPMHKLDIIGFYEEPYLLLFPQEKLADKEQQISFELYMDVFLIVYQILVF